MMKTYLVFCTWDYWCQGWEVTSGYFLVTAESFEHACDRIRNERSLPYDNKDMRNFENHTID